MAGSGTISKLEVPLAIPSALTTFVAEKAIHTLSHHLFHAMVFYIAFGIELETNFKKFLFFLLGWVVFSKTAFSSQKPIIGSFCGFVVQPHSARKLFFGACIRIIFSRVQGLEGQVRPGPFSYPPRPSGGFPASNFAKGRRYGMSA